MYNAPTMSTINPVLDQPQSVDYELLPVTALNWLANQELHCSVDANSDPAEVYWPWAKATYARRIRLMISDLQDGPLTPLAVRFFPGHQETISGAEGMIVTKRLIMPWKSPDDKALIWLLECQAEGDRLLKLEIEIEWGEPLSQRLVDGLLVAQRNPEAARGIYAQSNAESTRVFGNPYGRPDEVDLSDPARARLVYHVLINGTVEVPLLLTLSDVGEQVAWNGFLSLRDVEQIFDASSENWGRLLRTGRLWTSDPAYTRAVHAGKLEAVRRVQRRRSGWSPTDGEVSSIPALVKAWDATDPAVSRNLLAHLRRLAEEFGGKLPAVLPTANKEGDGVTAGAGANGLDAVAVLRSNGAYLQSLAAHLQHHGDGELLAAHLPAVRLCAEAVLQLWLQSRGGSATWDMAAAVYALQTAKALAQSAGSEVDAARWEGEAAYLQQVGPLPGAATPPPPAAWLAAVAMAGAAVWDRCGISCCGQELCVEPAWPQAGTWWALLGLPLANGKHLSLLWDGKTLHATQPVHSSLPVSLYKRIQIQHTDEFDFDPVFELTPDPHTGDTTVQRFKPTFVFN
jgi:hypothetical protein